MKKRPFELICVFILSLSLAGCLVRTYKVQKDRVDQDISGNRGYIQGETPAPEVTQRSSTRETVVIEVEFHSPIKWGGEKKQETKEMKKTIDRDLSGNLGYLEGGPEESAQRISLPDIEVTPLSEDEKEVSYIQYKVKTGDTLQKISKEFYGSYSKWTKIYNANRDKLKSPDDISPGQILDIPEE